MEDTKKQKVTQNIQRLASVASRLDNLNPETSAKIDKASESYLGIMKEAQYVGVQGYAIRNSRCFDNCLRQKRAKSDLPYDEIWNECHGEYLEAMSDEGSDTWNKYASKEDKDVRNLPSELVKTADTLLELSEQVDEDSAKELVAVANELIKEAGLWDRIKGVKNRMSPVFYQIRKVLDELHRAVNGEASSIQGAGGNEKAIIHAGRNTLKLLNQYANEIATNTAFNGLGKAGQEMRTQMTNQLKQVAGRFQAIKNIEEVEPTISDALSIIKRLSQNIFNQEKAEDIGDIDKDGMPDDQDIDDNNNGIRDDQEVIGNASSNASQMVSNLKQHLSQMGNDPNAQQQLSEELMKQLGIDKGWADLISKRLIAKAAQVASSEEKMTKSAARKRII